MQIETMTHLGLIRKNNEDRFFSRSFGEGSALLAVADGMGGHAAGEIAAAFAIEKFENFNPATEDPTDELVHAVHEAHRNILEATLADKSLKGMGTTLTAIFISFPNAWWVQVGDSRLYHFHDGALQLVTSDDTIPGSLVKKGELTLEQARFHPYGNLLLKCVGCNHFEPECGSLRLEPDDMLMLSSDGLHDLIMENDIEAVLSSRHNLREKLEMLVAKCLHVGGKDNITGILASI